MITLRLYLECIAGDWFAWIENFPGAYSQGTTQREAQEDAPRAFADYLQWARNHGEPLCAELADRKSADFLAETVETAEPGGESGAAFLQSKASGFFAMDGAPLASEQFEQYLRLLRHARADLIQAATALPPHEWDSAPFGERSIRGLMQHLTETEMEMLNRLGMEPTMRSHPDPLTTLNRMRTLFESAMQECFEKDCDTVISIEKERWSLRKVLRLALWHERYHTRQIFARSNPAMYMQSLAKAAVVDMRRRERMDSADRGKAEESEKLAEPVLAGLSSDYYL